MTQRSTQTERYWVADFELTQADIDHLYSVLLERETPLSVDEMALIVVRYRVQQEEDAIGGKIPNGNIYRPMNHYDEGDNLVFAGLSNLEGEVVGTRPGYNPDAGNFTVIQVRIGDQSLEYASDLQAEHVLNADTPVVVDSGQLERSPEDLFIEYGGEVAATLEHRLVEQSDLVRLAGRWFPRSLLADVNIGHLNLAEAVLDMVAGGPLSTSEIIEQMGVMSEFNDRLAEFSLNYALQRDARFDEVGPAGQVLWFLKRMEPTEVQSPPPRLAYLPIAYDKGSLSSELQELETEIGDEHSEIQVRRGIRPHSVTLLLTYPHKRAGTLPLSPQLRMMFPTAYEAPRIHFTLIDAETGEEIPAWVARPGGYVYGLKEWFAVHEVPVGGYLTIRREADPSRVKISYASRKARIEWVRTAIVNAGRVRFENRKLSIACQYDEFMIIAVEDPEAIDAVWAQTLQDNVPLASLVEDSCRELAPLGPQGAVHAKTLYSGVNLIRRCPPGPIFAALASSDRFEHVGGPYWRVKGSSSAA